VEAGEARQCQWCHHGPGRDKSQHRGPVNKCPYCLEDVADDETRCHDCGRAIGGDQDEINETAGLLERDGYDPEDARRMSADLVTTRQLGEVGLLVSAEQAEQTARLLEVLIPCLEIHRSDLPSGARFDSLRAYLTSEDRAVVDEIVGDMTVDQYFELHAPVRHPRRLSAPRPPTPRQLRCPHGQRVTILRRVFCKDCALELGSAEG
jgi:hypothetical protein